MKLPEGDRLQDASDRWHGDSWSSCPGGKPQVSMEQLAYGLMLLVPWFREEFAPPRKPAAPAERRPKKPKAAKVASALSSSTIPAAMRRDVLRRDEWLCQRCGRSITGIRAGLQHRRPRGMGGSKRLHTMANLVLLCGWPGDPGTCTEWVEHEDRAAAYAQGWLVPMGYSPEEWRVLRFGVRWEQPGDIWVPAKPHPDQANDNESEVA